MLNPKLQASSMQAQESQVAAQSPFDWGARIELACSFGWVLGRTLGAARVPGAQWSHSGSGSGYAGSTVQASPPNNRVERAPERQSGEPRSWWPRRLRGASGRAGKDYAIIRRCP